MFFIRLPRWEHALYSLAYWQQVHEAFFTECLAEAGLEFSQETGVVLEEFRKVYPLDQA